MVTRISLWYSYIHKPNTDIACIMPEKPKHGTSEKPSGTRARGNGQHRHSHTKRGGQVCTSSLCVLMAASPIAPGP